MMDLETNLKRNLANRRKDMGLKVGPRHALRAVWFDDLFAACMAKRNSITIVTRFTTSKH